MFSSEAVPLMDVGVRESSGMAEALPYSVAGTIAPYVF